MSNTPSLAPEVGITRAVRIAGGQAALSQKLNAGSTGQRTHVSQQAVSLWVRRGYAPINRVEEVSQCVGGRVAPVELLDPTLRRILSGLVVEKVGADETAT